VSKSPDWGKRVTCQGSIQRTGQVLSQSQEGGAQQKADRLARAREVALTSKKRSGLVEMEFIGGGAAQVFSSIGSPSQAYIVPAQLGPGEDLSMASKYHLSRNGHEGEGY